MQEQLAPDDPEADARLLQRARLDPQAFGILYQRFYPMILNYAFRRTLSIPAAEEVASNAFFKALRGLGKFDPAKNGSVRAWLYAIATNELRMLWRWRRRHPAMSLTELKATQRVSFDRAGMEQREEFARLHQGLARLGQRDQAILTLRYFERLSLEQIAQVTGKPLGSVKSRLHRATAKLRAAVGGAAAGEVEKIGPTVLRASL